MHALRWGREMNAPETKKATVEEILGAYNLGFAPVCKEDEEKSAAAEKLIREALRRLLESIDS